MALSKTVKGRIRYNRHRHAMRLKFSVMYRALPEDKKAIFSSLDNFVQRTLVSMTIGYNASAAQSDEFGDMFYPTRIEP